MLATVILTLVLFLAIYYIFSDSTSATPCNLPPGPTGVPLLGCLPWLPPAPCETFMRWSRRYGNVMSVRMGSELVVVLNGYDTIREALVNHWYQFSGRPLKWIWVAINDNKGLSSSDWSVWKEQRVTTLRILRHFGMGKCDMEERISKESGALVDAIGKMKGRPFDPTEYFHHATSNILVAIMFGKRMEYDDPEFEDLLKATLTLTRTGRLAGIVSFFPFLLDLPVSLPMVSPLRQSMLTLRDYMINKIEERHQLLNSQEPACFIDHYLVRAKEKSLDESQLPYVLIELILGGSDTTATTLKWCILNLVHNPKSQKKIHGEVDMSVKDGKELNYARRGEMPYTQACILETQRLATLFQLGIPHRTMENVTLHGYNIPKDTLIFPNLWSAQMDENTWKQPKEFDPTRFLDESGQVIANKERLIVFGLGARSCIGAQIAKVGLFIILTSLLKEFEFRTPEGEPLPSRDGIHGITYTPKQFNVVAVRRTP
ncbi:cytochrome P450 2U1-like [Ptychodera flava]|uniref:cytochrome P450 2U1-like n=1 Tax=Ptychodera flava TaxID=63121 RepID=UPI00396A50BE